MRAVSRRRPSLGSRGPAAHTATERQPGAGRAGRGIKTFSPGAIIIPRWGSTGKWTMTAAGQIASRERGREEERQMLSPAPRQGVVVYRPSSSDVARARTHTHTHTLAERERRAPRGHCRTLWAWRRKNDLQVVSFSCHAVMNGRSAGRRWPSLVRRARLGRARPSSSV